MRRLVIVLGAAAAVVVGSLGACAKGIGEDFDSGVGDDGAAACPQFDLMKDPQHCGSCTHACAAGEVCSAGACKAQCDLTLTKCTVPDAGILCIDTKTDPEHCGGCATVCKAGDAGTMALGTGNPDAGIPFPDGGFGGVGWGVGAPTCEAGTCGVACPQGMIRCSDNLCYDTQNFHDRCGDCTTACQPDEWCGLGHCCPAEQMYCGGACVDVLADNANCGGCGVACGGMTPYCSAGKCVMGCVPTGQRAPLNTMSGDTASGCWNGNPCGTGSYSWNSTNGQNFAAVAQQVTCSGASTCVGHVGINTYSATNVCSGVWDVYCDATKVGTINTLNKACAGSAMANGCNVTFTPRPCTSIKLEAAAGASGAACCGGGAPDSMLTGVSAW